MNAYVICALLFCAPFASASLSSTVDITLHNYEEECAEETGVSLQSIEAARKQHKIPESGELDQFSVCMLKKFNVLNQDGSVNPDVRSYHIVTDNVYIYQKSEICKNSGGRDQGEVARNIMNCYLDAVEIVLGLTPNPKATN